MKNNLGEFGGYRNGSIIIYRNRLLFVNGFYYTHYNYFAVLRVDLSFNLIPLIDIFASPVEYITNTILNILLFIPMGFLLPAIWKAYRPIKKTVLMGLLISVIIELLQIFTFRLTDIDDLITNTLGTFLGYYCGKMFSFKLPFKMSTNDENISTKYELMIILVTIFLIAFFLKPLVSNEIWDIVLSSPLWEKIK